MKILVTGGAGFIGSHVVDAFVERGAEVLCLDSLDPGVYRSVPTYLNPLADYCFADLRHWTPDDRFGDVNAVLHLAAIGGVGRARREPGNVLAANVGGTARLIDVIRTWPRLERVVVASSFSVYGSAYQYLCATCGHTQDGTRAAGDLDRGSYELRCARCGAQVHVVPLDEQAPPNPSETYGASKYMQELCFRGFDASPVHIVRQSSVYGPRLRLDDGEATIIAKIAGWIARGERPQLFEDGNQIRDWVYVGDTVAAIAALIDHGGPSVVNVCTGTPLSLAAGARTLAAVMHSDIAPQIVGGYRPGDMRHCLGDPSTLRALINREPMSFDEGAQRTFGTDRVQVAHVGS